jgi:glutamate-1-semialdehyde 2,1-aminomutase
MGAMHEFLIRLDRPEIRKLYDNLDALWDERSRRLNHRLADEGLPLRGANMSTVWTVCYKKPSAL